MLHFILFDANSRVDLKPAFFLSLLNEARAPRPYPALRDDNFFLPLQRLVADKMLIP